MTGLVVAKLTPASAETAKILVGVAALSALAGLFVARRSGWRAHGLWGSFLILAAGLAGFSSLQLRYPYLHTKDGRPPREVTIILSAQQIFPLAASARSITGIGKVVSAGSNETELIGRPIYFSVIRRISVPPQRSGHYRITGVIESLPPSDGKGFHAYLENRGIRQQLTRAHLTHEVQAPTRFRAFCHRAQARLVSILQRGIEDHPKLLSLYLAMLLGEKAELSPEQESAFMQSGTFHIFSISGLHVGVIALALQGVLQFLRLPLRVGILINLIVLWFYVQITGGSSPAERSFLMIAFLLATRVFRLPGNGLAALVAAALFTLLLNPLQLFDTGFQMSYSVVIALVVMSVPLGERWLAKWRPFAFLPRQDWSVRQVFIAWAGRQGIAAVAASWGAFLASTPASIGYFSLLSPSSLVANLVIIPLSSLAIIAGFLSLLFGLAGLTSISVLFNSAAALTLLAADWLVREGSGFPGMYFKAEFSHAWMTPAAMAAMTAVMLAGVAGHWRRRYGGYWPPVIALGLIVIFGAQFGQ